MHCLITGGGRGQGREEVTKNFILHRDSAVIDRSRMKGPTLFNAEVALRFLLRLSVVLTVFLVTSCSDSAVF